jgi:hypothetical protein
VSESEQDELEGGESGLEDADEPSPDEPWAKTSSGDDDL